MVKIIKISKEVTPKELAEELFIDIAKIKLYLKQIEEYLEKDNLNLSYQQLIKKIHYKKNILQILRKNNIFGKTERKEVLLYYLLIFPFVNLSSLANTLNITKRTLNYDLQDIKKELSKEYVIIGYNKNGIYLKCSTSRKVKMMNGILYKFSLEKDFLPTEIRNIYARLIKKSGIKSQYAFKKQCKAICEIMNINYSRYYSLTLPMVYYNLSHFKRKDKLKYIPQNEILKYRDNIISKSHFFKIQIILKNSPFGELSKSYMHYLMIVIYYSINYPKVISPITLTSLEKIKIIIGKYLGEEYIPGENYFTEGKKWIEYCYFRKKHNIFDLNLALINLNINKDEILEKTIEEIKTFVPFFSRGDFLKLMGTFIKKDGINVKKNIFIHSSELNTIKFLIKEKLEKNYSIKILDIIHQKDIENYLKENKIDNIITIENIKIKGINKIINYKL